MMKQRLDLNLQTHQNVGKVFAFVPLGQGLADNLVLLNAVAGNQVLLAPNSLWRIIDVRVQEVM